jgi:hypothetical protein
MSAFLFGYSKNKQSTYKVLDMASGFQLRRSMERKSKVVVIDGMWEGG